MDLFRLFGTIAVNNDEANRDIDETTDKAESSEKRMTSAFKKIGLAVASYFTFDAVKSFGTEIVNASAEVSAEASAFEQIMGDYSSEASKKVEKIADSTGMVSTRLTPYMTSMTAKFKGLGYDIDDATTLAQDGLNLAADAAAFWDKSLDDSMSGLNSFVNGSYEGGEAIGLFANDTQMAAYAVENGIVESTAAWSSLDEATKQATRLDYAKTMYDQSGATGQAAKEADQYANVQANLSEKWRQFKAEIGEPVLQNIVLPAMDKLSGLVDTASQKFEDLQKWVSENKTLLTAIGVVIGALTAGIIAYNVAQAAMTLGAKLHAAASLSEKLAILGVNTAMLTSPITWIVAAIVALIAIVILLVKNWDKVKEVATNVWEKIKEVWGAVSEWFKTNIIDPIVNFFTGLWDKIVEIWEGIKNAISVAIQFIAAIFSAAFQIITLPFRFIWENCKDTVFTVLNAIKQFIQNVFNGIKTVITTILNAIKTVWNTVWTAIKNFFTPILNGIKKVVTTVFNAIKQFIQNFCNGIKIIITTVWNAIKTTITTVINGIKKVVTTVFNAIKNAISVPLNAAKTIVTNIFDAIKSKIETVINGAKNIVQKGLDAIKGFFNKLKLKLPDIKLPHFKIDGEFSLNPPKVPKLKIDWYAKAMNDGMILNKPTIFGINANGQPMGAGEAGSETVVGTNSLMSMINRAVKNETSTLSNQFERLISILATYFPEILAAMKKNIILDSGVIVGELAPDIDSKLGDITRLRARGQ